MSALVVQMGSSLLELFLKTTRITHLYLTLLEKISVQYISDIKSAKETGGHGDSTGDYFVLTSVFQPNIWSHLVQQSVRIIIS